MRSRTTGTRRGSPTSEGSNPLTRCAQLSFILFVVITMQHSYDSGTKPAETARSPAECVCRFVRGFAPVHQGDFATPTEQTRETFQGCEVLGLHDRPGGDLRHGGDSRRGMLEYNVGFPFTQPVDDTPYKGRRANSVSHSPVYRSVRLPRRRRVLLSLVPVCVRNLSGTHMSTRESSISRVNNNVAIAKFKRVSLNCSREGILCGFFGISHAALNLLLCKIFCRTRFDTKKESFRRTNIDLNADEATCLLL